MVRLVAAVMMVSGGLAVLAWSMGISPVEVGAVPFFVLGVAGVVVGLFLAVLDHLQRRERVRGWRRRQSVPADWHALPEFDGERGLESNWQRRQDRFDRPDRADRSWDLGGSVNRARVREAARSLVFSFEGDARDAAARERRAVRSACRRSHVRAAAAVRPKRHRVRPRARIFM